MTAVNPGSDHHVADLLGRLLTRAKADISAEDWGGLRPSHFRVVEAVLCDGISVTELAERVGMTKQGVGQFVAQLVSTGHLVSEVHPDDARVRIVRRTHLGDQLVTAVARRVARIERDWAASVGPRRYATFRKVLEQLTVE